MANQIILDGYIVVPDADLSAVIDELPRHIELTRAEQGCIAFDVIQDKQSRYKFTVYEKFSSREAFEFHQHRVRSSAWGLVAKNVERYYKII